MAYVRVKAKKPIVLNGFALCPKENNPLPTDPVKVQFWAKVQEIQKEEAKEEEKKEEEPITQNQLPEKIDTIEKTEVDQAEPEKKIEESSVNLTPPPFATGMTLLRELDSGEY
mmetsp:Transcript_5323/g.8212  ORF Transcript_5323/g.8212 Transcript_5323/m.8212 type:complete len:113 (-) Transcript_5323:202-540(-)